MTPKPKKTTDDLFAEFDLALFEQIDGGLFRAVGSLPQWMQANFQPVHTHGIDLADRFPMLEIFLPECEAAHEAGMSEPIRSDIWTEPDGSGGELYLQAVATALGRHLYMALRSLPQALFTYQQLAHDFELEKEKVERLSRQLEVKRREAERATQAKSDFLAAMSHEIRTPLNAIIGMADVLSLTQLTGEQKKYVEIFQRNGVSLLNLINDILDLSKVEAAHVELETAELDMVEVVARAMEVVEVRASAKGLWLRQTIAPDVPRYLIGDPGRLRQIIINLLGNSIKFTEHGGLDVKVEIDPENPGPGHLRFAITDTGIGIPADKVGLIFESFTQADSSTTRKYGGTGLGLSISRQLVELMQGRIWVESKVGAGSTFFFTAHLGVQEDQSERAVLQAAKTPQASVAELATHAHGLRILLVDDSEDNRVLILSYLKRTHSAIAIAENGRIAVDLFQKNRYDLVLMDVEMPVMDGYEAVREIRRIEQETGATPTPVLALTAHAFADMADRGFEAGFTDLLTKPIRHLTLLEALARYGASEKAASFRVRIDKGMEDVVPAYLAKRRAEVAIYREALIQGDLVTIAKLAHKMKGTGAGYGFPTLTDLGAAMEKSALHCDADAIRDQIEAFASYVDRVEPEYPV